MMPGMAIEIDCSICDAPLDLPGSLFITAPEPDDVESVSKLHLCPECDAKVNALMEQMWEEAHPDDPLVQASREQ